MRGINESFNFHDKIRLGELDYEIEKKEQRILRMERHIKNRTYYGKLSDYECDLYYEKRRLRELKGEE